MSASSGLHSACSAFRMVRRARPDASGNISLSCLANRGTADEGVLTNSGAVDSDARGGPGADVGNHPRGAVQLHAGARIYYGTRPGHGERDEGPPPALRHSLSAEEDQRRIRWARAAAIGQVASILVGWGLAQQPYIIVPDLTFINAATVPKMLHLLRSALTAGAVVLFPSFVYLLLCVQAPAR
jgi:hypothetical protein